MAEEMEAQELKQHVISALEAPLDIHQERIDDDSLEITAVEFQTEDRIRCRVAYHLVHLRCCAGPSLETKINRELILIRAQGKWVDWIES